MAVQDAEYWAQLQATLDRSAGIHYTPDLPAQRAKEYLTERIRDADNVRRERLRNLYVICYQLEWPIEEILGDTSDDR